MKTTAALATTLIALIVASGRAAVTFDWAHVGNAGNAADPQTGFGAVSCNYAISKTEVTNAQYVEFLNAVDPTGANPNLGGGDDFLYNFLMSTDSVGGIKYNGGAANGSKYEIKSRRDNNPVVYVSYFAAMRFTNWLHNGQGSGDTETGAYTIGSGTDEVRSASAKYWIPSEDEWYKAAFYDPSGVYYDYPTGTDTVPYSDNASSLNTPDDTNVANFLKDDSTANGFDDGYAVTGSTSFVNGQSYLSDVGAYSLVASPYGTYDQGGNAWEWIEAITNSPVVPSLQFRGLRGGSWIDESVDMRADNRDEYGPTAVNGDIGFRVATVPEPSALLFGALASVGLLMRRRA